MEGRVGRGSDWNCVVRYCPSPMTAIVCNKYFAITIPVIGEGP